MKNIIYFSVMLFVIACGDDAKENNASNNSTTNNTSTNNTSTNNTSTNNTSTNNTSTNNAVPCGDVTFEGMCEGTMLKYCDPDEGVVEIDCTDVQDATGTCIDIPDYGSDCAVAVGDSCFDVEGEYHLFCDGTNTACIWEADGYTCKDNAVAQPCDSETFEPSCDGNLYTYDCLYGQPIAVDCVAIGGLCDAAEGCLVAADGQCDDVVANCSGELTCGYENDGDYFGICE